MDKLSPAALAERQLHHYEGNRLEALRAAFAGILLTLDDVTLEEVRFILYTALELATPTDPKEQEPA